MDRTRNDEGAGVPERAPTHIDMGHRSKVLSVTIANAAQPAFEDYSSSEHRDRRRARLVHG
jgi:hypothetical protein